MNISIVPQKALRSDPRQILYHYPSMTAIRYSKLASPFYHWKTVQAVEEVARIQNFLVVPASVIHWKRKKEITEERKIKIGSRMYYLLKPTELSPIEAKKLQEYAERKEEREISV